MNNNEYIACHILYANDADLLPEQITNEAYRHFEMFSLPSSLFMSCK